MTVPSSLILLVADALTGSKRKAHAHHSPAYRIAAAPSK